MEKISYEKYYQSETIWVDRQDTKFKVIFGYFYDEKEADTFNKEFYITWDDGKFYINRHSDRFCCSQIILSQDDITYADGSAIDNRKNLYSEYTVMQLMDCKAVECERKLDIHQAYKELWRFIYNIIDNLGEAILYNGELQNRDTPLNNGFRVWKNNIKLMAGENFESSDQHNTRISDYYELLSTIFINIDNDEAYNNIKYGQSLRFARFRRDAKANNNIMNGKYVFK